MIVRNLYNNYMFFRESSNQSIKRTRKKLVLEIFDKIGWNVHFFSFMSVETHNYMPRLPRSTPMSNPDLEYDIGFIISFIF